MALTPASLTLDGILLPPALLWADEFNWSPIQSSQEYAVTGALIVDTALRLAGRPVTLEAGDDRAWIDRATLQRLHALTLPVDRQMILDQGGRARPVIWRPDAAPISAYPIWPLANPQPDLAYIVTLRLTEV